MKIFYECDCCGSMGSGVIMHHGMQIEVSDGKPVTERDVTVSSCPPNWLGRKRMDGDELIRIVVCSIACAVKYDKDRGYEVQFTGETGKRRKEEIDNETRKN